MAPNRQQLKYHACTFEIIRRGPRWAPEAAPDLEALDEALRETFGTGLPESAREWYSLEGAAAILREFSNEDEALSPSEMLKELANRRPQDGHWQLDLVAERMLPLIWENQGVVLWCLKLDGSDDPPVVIYDDLRVNPCAESLSRFAQSCRSAAAHSARAE